jgi:hypothetical protein
MASSLVQEVRGETALVRADERDVAGADRLDGAGADPNRAKAARNLRVETTLWRPMKRLRDPSSFNSTTLRVQIQNGKIAPMEKAARRDGFRGCVLDA